MLHNHLPNISKYAKAVETLQTVARVEVGNTAKQTVYKEDKVKLYRYHASTEQTVRTPLLLVYALVNRYYIADLDEKRSLIKKLVDHGMDVYAIDWGYPDPADRYLDLADYIQGYIHNCVRTVLNSSNSSSLNLLGICQGGTFSCCYTALHPENVRNLVAMVTPIDFATQGNTLGNMAGDIDVKQVVSAMGNIKGSWLNSNFNALNPLNLNYLKYANAVDSLQEPEQAAFFLRMEKWIQDSPDQSGAALAEFIEKLYQQNALVNGQMTIGDCRIDTSRITQPVLNVYGTEDHIVPPQSSKALQTVCASKDYSELVLDTGHIGMYVSSKSRQLPGKIANWLQQRD